MLRRTVDDMKPSMIAGRLWPNDIMATEAALQARLSASGSNMLLEVETVVAPEAAASPPSPPPAEPSSGSEGEAEAGCCASYGEGAMGVECCHTLLDASEDDCTEATVIGGGTKWFTECPVAIPGPPPPACTGENPTFVDEGGFSCDAWDGYDCTTAMADYGYTVAETQSLIANCPICCAGSSAVGALASPPSPPSVDNTSLLSPPPPPFIIPEQSGATLTLTLDPTVTFTTVEREQLLDAIAVQTGIPKEQLTLGEASVGTKCECAFQLRLQYCRSSGLSSLHK